MNIVNTITCVHCETEFDPTTKFHRKGKINECGHCAKDVPKFIGQSDASAKSGAGLNIYRDPALIKTMGQYLRRTNAIGFNANLPMNSPTSNWDDKKANPDDV